MKVKTSELSGKALDWAVAETQGRKRIATTRKEFGLNVAKNIVPPYSTEWVWCGPLAEELKISCYCSIDPENETAYHWCAVKEVVDYRKRRGFTAETPQIAICRAVVAAKLGDDVDIPDELMEVGE